MIEVITPQWNVPAHVKACTTTRIGGVSVTPFDSLNLGDHVNDDAIAVAENRARLKQTLHLQSEPAWLQQAHTTTVVCADEPFDSPPLADASFTHKPGRICVVLTADCLPILLSNDAGTEVAAIHAGWRGLADGILFSTLESLDSQSHEMHVWLGPAIGPNAFEVGDDVVQAFLSQDNALAEHFKPKGDDKYWADLYAIARFQGARAGVKSMTGGADCTFTDAERFYSYRRDGQTGRMASLIWLEKS